MVTCPIKVVLLKHGTETGTFASASRAKDKIGESFRFGNGWGTSTARGSAAQDFLIVTQLVVPTIKCLLDYPGMRQKPAHQKERPPRTPYLYGVG